VRANACSRGNQRDKKRIAEWGPRIKRNNGNGSRTRAKSARHLPQSCRKSKTPLTIFLVNGVKLQGVVTWFDNFCVLLRRDGHSQLVYKHAISTIMPGHPIQLFEGRRGSAAEKA
jgi:host factor-I protein